MSEATSGFKVPHVAGIQGITAETRGAIDASNHIAQITSTSAETGKMASDARDD